MKKTVRRQSIWYGLVRATLWRVRYRHHVSFAVPVVLAALGCGSTSGPRAEPPQPVASVMAASETARPGAVASAPPVIRVVWPDGIAKRGGPDVEPRAGHKYPLPVACEATGRFDLSAMYDEPRCGIKNGDPRLTWWHRAIPVDAGPFVIRAVHDASAIHAQGSADFEVEVEIENLGADTELIQADDDAMPRVFALEAEPKERCDANEDACCMPVWGSVRGGTLEPGKRRWKNPWTGIRWKSHAIGVLRVSVAPGTAGRRHDGEVWWATSTALPPRKYDLFSSGWSHEGDKESNLEKVGELFVDSP